MAREQLHKARAPSPAEEELNRQLDFAKDRLERSEHQRRLAENKLAETEQALVEVRDTSPPSPRSVAPCGQTLRVQRAPQRGKAAAVKELTCGPVQGQAGADRAVGELHALVAAAQANSKRWKQEALDLAQQLASALSSVSPGPESSWRLVASHELVLHRLVVSAHHQAPIVQVSAQERQLGRAAGERAVLEHNLLAAVSAH